MINLLFTGHTTLKKNLNILCCLSIVYRQVVIFWLSYQKVLQNICENLNECMPFQSSEVEEESITAILQLVIVDLLSVNCQNRQKCLVLLLPYYTTQLSNTFSS